MDLVIALIMSEWRCLVNVTVASMVRDLLIELLLKTVNMLGQRIIVLERAAIIMHGQLAHHGVVALRICVWALHV